MPCRDGSPLFLTPDMASKLDFQGYDVPCESLILMNPTNLVQMAKLDSSKVTFAHMLSTNCGVNGENHVTISGTSRSRVTMEAFSSSVNAMGVDAVVSLADLASSGKSNFRQQKAVTRTIGYYEHLKENFKGFIIGNIVGEDRHKDDNPYLMQKTRCKEGLDGCDSFIGSETNGSIRFHLQDEPIERILCLAAKVDVISARKCLEEACTKGHAFVFTNDLHIDLRDEKYADDFSPISKDCKCYTCSRFTCAYLNHLLFTKEMLVNTLLMMHNFHALQNKIMQSHMSA